MPKHDIAVDLSKRNFLKVGGVAAVGALTLSTTGCPGGPSMNTWVQTIIGGLQELGPLLPGQAALLTKAVGIAKSFNDAWQSGKFTNAVGILENLTTTIQQIIADAGINLSPQVKTMLAVVGVALRTVAVIMKEQLNNPDVADAVRRQTSSPGAARQRALIERMADSKTVDALFEAAKP